MTTSTRPSLAGALALVMALGAARAEAQQQAPSPSRDTPPAVPQPAAAPAPRPAPATAPPPTPSGRAGAPAPSPAAAQVANPVAPPPTGSAVPPDSVRPAAVVAPARPANAVAQCGDGSYVVSPQDASACRGRQGLRAAFPQQQSAPVRPVAAPMPVAATPLNQGAPPAGATMQCKDGTFLFGTPAAGRCDANGGVAATLVAPRPAPAAPSEVRRP